MAVKPVTGLDLENKTTEREINRLIQNIQRKALRKYPEGFSFTQDWGLILHIKKKGNHLSLIYAY